MDETQPHTGPEMMPDDALDAQIGYNLKRASAFALNDFAVELTEAGLRPVTYGMLALIDERPGIRAAELCRLLGMKSANMAPLLAELEERGLVERDDHAEDRRVRMLTLTPGGQTGHAWLSATGSPARGQVSAKADEEGAGDAAAPAAPDLDGGRVRASWLPRPARKAAASGRAVRSPAER